MIHESCSCSGHSGEGNGATCIGEGPAAVQEEHRRQSREAARLMCEEFASRQAEALRNKAAAEADRGHVAIYMPPRPRPPAAAPDPARADRDPYGPDPRAGAPWRQPSERRRRDDVGGAGVRRRLTEEEQPVGGRASGNEQLSPEQRCVTDMHAYEQRSPWIECRTPMSLHGAHRAVSEGRPSPRRELVGWAGAASSSGSLQSRTGWWWVRPQWAEHNASRVWP